LPELSRYVYDKSQQALAQFVMFYIYV